MPDSQEVRKRRLPEYVMTLEPEQGSPAKRNKIDNDNDNEVAPDGWRALEGDGKVLNGWRGDMKVACGGKDVTVPTDDQAGQQEGTELASMCSVDVGTVGGGQEDSNTKNDRGIVVRGGKKGKGQSLFTVRNIADHFKVMASAANVHNQNVTPKRKQENVDFVDSPTTKRRKLKFIDTQLLWNLFCYVLIKFYNCYNFGTLLCGHPVFWRESFVF